MVGRSFWARLQRSPGAPSRDCLHGRRPCGHQGAEDPRGSARRRQEAVEPERHRPGARRLDSQPHLGGGGRAFAAKPRDFSQKVNRKMYRAAMQTMVSQLLRDDRLVAVESIELSAPRTKLLISKLGEFGLSRALILVEAYEEKLFLAARNIPHVEVMAVSALDPLSLVKHDKVVATVGALKLLDQRLGGAHE